MCFRFCFSTLNKLCSILERLKTSFTQHKWHKFRSDAWVEDWHSFPHMNLWSRLRYKSQWASWLETLSSCYWPARTWLHLNQQWLHVDMPSWVDIDVASSSNNCCSGMGLDHFSGQCAERRVPSDVSHCTSWMISTPLLSAALARFDRRDWSTQALIVKWRTKGLFDIQVTHCINVECCITFCIFDVFSLPLSERWISPCCVPDDVLACSRNFRHCALWVLIYYRRKTALRNSPVKEICVHCTDSSCIYWTWKLLRLTEWSHVICPNRAPRCFWVT